MVNLYKPNDLAEITNAYRIAAADDQAAYEASFLGDYEQHRPLMVETGRRLAIVQKIACEAGVHDAILDLG